jgi:hypothetical protein
LTSTLKLEATCPLKRRQNFNGLHSVVFQMMELFKHSNRLSVFKRKVGSEEPRRAFMRYGSARLDGRRVWLIRLSVSLENKSDTIITDYYCLKAKLTRPWRGTASRACAELFGLSDRKISLEPVFRPC